MAFLDETGLAYFWNQILARLNKFVPAESGKGLSSNDYTDAAKAKVDALAPVATSGSYDDLTNKPTIPAPVTEQTVSGWGFTKNTGTYSKPTGGIPKTDLANDVQASLGKAETALQEHQSLAAYRTAAAQDEIDIGKVDKVTGKGLSTNDYTASAKAKVDAIPANPKYTDTVYDDTALKERVATIEGKESAWDAKLNASELPTAINTALAQAKASGEFDGADGKSAYAYAVEGGYTGTEAEFAAKLAQEKFANPNALTFAGAVTGSYDGSAPVSVEIPSGGGSGSSENWRLVNTVTTAEDVKEITITQDSDGNPLSLKKVKVFAKVRGNSAGLSGWCRITVNNLNGKFYSDIQNTFAAKEGQDYYNYAKADFAVYAGRLMLELLLRSLNNAASKNTLFHMTNTGCYENYPDFVDAITSIHMWSVSAGIGAGTELMIYGVDA